MKSKHKSVLFNNFQSFDRDLGKKTIEYDNYQRDRIQKDVDREMKSTKDETITPAVSARVQSRKRLTQHQDQFRNSIQNEHPNMNLRNLSLEALPSKFSKNAILNTAYKGKTTVAVM